MNISRYACTFLVALTLTAPAYAQDPAPAETQVEGPTATGGAAAPAADEASSGVQPQTGGASVNISKIFK